MVCHGTGMVWENPTRGLPVLNPSAIVATTVSRDVCGDGMCSGCCCTALGAPGSREVWTCVGRVGGGPGGGEWRVEGGNGGVMGLPVHRVFMRPKQ